MSLCLSALVIGKTQCIWALSWIRLEGDGRPTQVALSSVPPLKMKWNSRLTVYYWRLNY